jgi:hypothetical protein
VTQEEALVEEAPSWQLLGVLLTWLPACLPACLQSRSSTCTINRQCISLNPLALIDVQDAQGPP